MNRLGTGLAVLIAFAPCTVTAQFVDVAQDLGLTWDGPGMGASWGDVNGDGRPDLWLGNHLLQPHRLYVQTAAGVFVDASSDVSDAGGDFHGAAFADFDNDGDDDLFVAVGGDYGAGIGPNRLFVNVEGKLTDAAVVLGIDYPYGRGRHGTWFDWNGDRHLDLAFIGNNERVTPPEAPSRIFTWDQAVGTFVIEPQSIHRSDNNWWSQVLLANRAIDGPALLVQTNQLFPDVLLAYGAGGFTDRRATFAVPNLSQVSDAAFGDLDNDLDTDLVCVRQGKAMFLSQSVTGVTDFTATVGTSVKFGISVVTADFDNDMDLDLYVARGDRKSKGNLPNAYLENKGNNRFASVAGAAGAAGITNRGMSGSATTVDFDRDGFMDILVFQGDDWFVLDGVSGPLQLFRNTGNANRWLEIDLVGVTSNRDGIGAVVYVTAGGVTQLRERTDGSHMFSQNQKRLHFGLAQWTQADMVEVRWPSGIVQVFHDVAANQILAIREDEEADPPRGPAPVAVAAVGARKWLGANIVDKRPDGRQELSTFWRNEDTISTAWFTLDVGATRAVAELMIGPDGNFAHAFEIHVGDTLSGGQVTGGATATCNVPVTGVRQPSALSSCPLGVGSGRYVTVRQTSPPQLRVYGAELYVQ